MKSVERKYSKNFDIVGLGRDDQWKAHVAKEQKRLAYAILGKDRVLLSRCPICEHNESSEFVKVYDYPYNECKSCGHIFSAHSPNKFAIRNLYTESGGGKDNTVRYLC